MKLKKIIAIFCLMVLSIQMLPVQQIGAILSSNQLTEEIPHSLDYGKKLQIEKQSDNYLLSVFNYHLSDLNNTNNHSIHSHAPLVKLHIAEVQTPPPNLV
jgi:hypothetical protein